MGRGGWWLQSMAQRAGASQEALVAALDETESSSLFALTLWSQLWLPVLPWLLESLYNRGSI